jgi:hypothetical protein
MLKVGGFDTTLKKRLIILYIHLQFFLPRAVRFFSLTYYVELQQHEGALPLNWRPIQKKSMCRPVNNIPA